MGHISVVKQIWARERDPGSAHISAQSRPQSAQRTRITLQGVLTGISKIILESEQGGFLLALASDLPQKSFLIPSESEELKSHRIAFVKCASCGVLEKSEKFQKCSRCGSVCYCSKACRRNDWPNHKQICKTIKH